MEWETRVIEALFQQLNFYKNIFVHYTLFIFIFGHAESLLLQRLFSNCSDRGLLLVVACRLLVAMASLVVEHGLSGRQASEAVVPRHSQALENRLYNCGTQA